MTIFMKRKKDSPYGPFLTFLLLFTVTGFSSPQLFTGNLALLFLTFQRHSPLPSQNILHARSLRSLGQLVRIRHFGLDNDGFSYPVVNNMSLWDFTFFVIRRIIE